MASYCVNVRMLLQKIKKKQKKTFGQTLISADLRLWKHALD